MSVLTAARNRRSPGLEPAARAVSLADALVGLGLAVGLGAVSLIGAGGNDLAPNTWIEIGVLVVGVGLAVAALLICARARAWGSAALILFASLAAFTAASIAWSVQPAGSWVEANRTVSYLAAFGGAIALARIAPGRWAAVIGAVAVLATVLSGYSLLVKVFPATLDPGDQVGRLRLPFDYWNAVGLMAGMGLPACLWAGARREAGRLSRTLAVPAVGVLVVAIVLSLSRGALLIAVVGLAIWLALVPLRLRAAAILIAGMVGGGAACAWALSRHALVNDRVAQHARTAVGHRFGLVLVAMIAVALVVGFGVATALDRARIGQRTRRRIGAALLAAVTLCAIAGVVAVGASSRGLTGTISHAYHQLTSPNSSGAANVPGRLLSLGSTRGRYWNEGLRVGEHALLNGTGAGGFATATTRYTPNPTNQFVAHAHSYVIETFADLGLIGLALSLGLLFAWGAAARRAVAFGRRTAPERRAERDGLVTLLAVVVVFGLSSAIDWTWFVPGTALTALVCAGFLAGRGPLGEPVGRRARPPSGVSAVGLVAVAAAATLIAAWMIFQPLRSANADAAALIAATQGRLGAAIGDARAAATDDPVSVDPLFELAAFYRAAGNDGAAIAELRRAIRLQPDNPQTWIEEGRTLLSLDRPAEALPVLEHALSLARGSFALTAMIGQARAELRP